MLYQTVMKILISGWFIIFSSFAAYATEINFKSIFKNNVQTTANIQEKLNALGFEAGNVDGLWGRKTERALLKFIERFPPFKKPQNPEDYVTRLDQIHQSWFASPFENGKAIVTPNANLNTTRIYKSDIRDEGYNCAACLVITQPLGIGDFDGDKRDELLIGRHLLESGKPSAETSKLLVLDLSKNGYASELEIDTIAQNISRSHEREAVIADFNGDGIDDFFIAAHGLDTQPFPGEQNILVLSTPNGPIEVSDTNLPLLNDMSHGADGGDIDGDGDIDIVIATHRGSEKIEPYVLLNNGEGSFKRVSLAKLIDDPSLIKLYPRNSRRKNQFSSFRLIDLDRDEAPELVLLRSDQSKNDKITTSHILWNNGKGMFSIKNVTHLPTDRWGYSTYTNDAEGIDLNGDGLLDLILTQSTRYNGGWRGHFIQILIQEKPKIFVDRTAERFWDQGYTVPMMEQLFADETEMVDLNADGHLDIVTRSLAPATITGDLSGAIGQIGINDGTGRFLPLDPRWLSQGQAYHFRGPTPGRFGPKGEIGIITYSMEGKYDTEPHRTWGASLRLHTLQ